MRTRRGAVDLRTPALLLLPVGAVPPLLNRRRTRTSSADRRNRSQRSSSSPGLAARPPAPHWSSQPAHGYLADRETACPRTVNNRVSGNNPTVTGHGGPANEGVDTVLLRVVARKEPRHS